MKGESVSTNQPARKSGGAGQYVLMAIIIIIAIGGIAGFGFYGEEIGSFFRLQGWNLGAVTQKTREFVDAAAVGDGDKVASYLQPNNTMLKTVEQNGKLVAIMVPDYGGPAKRTLKQIAPTNQPQIGPPQLMPLDGGAVQVLVTYPKSHAVQIRWDRKEGGWKVVGMGWVTISG